MSDKKIERKDLPRPEKDDKRNKSQEEFDLKTSDNINDRSKIIKKKRVNYVVKDLPIY